LNIHGIAIALLCAGCTMPGPAVAGELLDDPTRPSSARSASELRPPGPRELQLQGIVHHNERRVAIVDGNVLHEGDRIDNARIEEITADAVRYSRDGHHYTARIARKTVQVRQPNVPRKERP
jgi:hypothetical protein